MILGDCMGGIMIIIIITIVIIVIIVVIAIWPRASFDFLMFYKGDASKLCARACRKEAQI